MQTKKILNFTFILLISMNLKSAEKTDSLNNEFYKYCVVGQFDKAQECINLGASVNFTPSVAIPTLLYQSVQCRNIPLIKFLVSNRANIDIHDSIMDTPLIAAAKNKSLDIIIYLILSGSNLNLQNNQGHDYRYYLSSTLNKLIYYILSSLPNSFSDIDKLISNGLNTKDSQGKTLFMEAASEGDLDTLYVLLKYSPNIDDCDNWGDTALIQAAKKRDLKTILFLLEIGANPNLKNKGRLKYTDYLDISSRKKISMWYTEYKLKKAFLCNDWQSLKIILKNNKSLVNHIFENKTLLMHACAAKDINMVENLLNYKADVNININGTTALKIALLNENSHIINCLLFRKAILDEETQQMYDKLILKRATENLMAVTSESTAIPLVRPDSQIENEISNNEKDEIPLKTEDELKIIKYGDSVDISNNPELKPDSSEFPKDLFEPLKMELEEPKLTHYSLPLNCDKAKVIVEKYFDPGHFGPVISPSDINNKLEPDISNMDKLSSSADAAFDQYVETL